MATIRQHLARFHQRAAADHAVMAKCFSKLAGYSKAAKSEMKDEPMGLGEVLMTLADTHEAASQFHKESMDECMKGMDDVDLNKLAPTGVHAFAPPSIRAVTRTGQREIAEPEVAPEFAKLVSVDE